MAVFEGSDEEREAEREGWLKDGKLTYSGYARLQFEKHVAPGYDPRQVARRQTDDKKGRR